MARHKVLLAVEVVFDGDYYEQSELVRVTWGWLEGSLTDRDDLQSSQLVASLVIDPEAKVTLKFQGDPTMDVQQHWAPESGTS